MRIGKHEGMILTTLRICHDNEMDWTWHGGQGIGRLANTDDILSFEAGNIVPIWMLRRDVSCGKTVLSRSLKTLEEKGLIILLDGSLSSPYPEVSFSRYAKYVSITNKGLNKTEKQ